MAIPWLSLLNTVPWSEVIRNAPKLADAAGKLWKTVARRPAASAALANATTEALITNAPDSAALSDARIVALEASVAELDQQMLASSELIRALVEQNSALIAAIETHRRQRIWLITLAGSALIVAVGAMAFAILAGRP